MGELEQIPNHQVKVDNWPLFFLQRLHHFYRKKSHCDLTLLFSTLDSIKSVKVHKLVLHACTDYFETLDVMKDSEHGEFLQLSNEMQPDVVIPIISFMYTGKLEFPVTLQPRLYEAATKLRMTILTKLLDVQPSKVSVKKAVSQPSEEPVTKVLVPENEALSSANVTDSQDTQEINSSPADISLLQTNLPSRASPKHPEDPIVTLMPVSVAPSQQNLTTKPNVTFLQCSETEKVNSPLKQKLIKKSVGLHLTSVTTKAKVVDVSLPPTLPGRKLPVWKRKVPLTASQFGTENSENIRTSFRLAEKPKPTRFEWEEDLSDPTSLKPVEEALKILSHEGCGKILHPLVLHPDGTAEGRDSFDDVSKRTSEESCDSPPYKRSRASDLQDMKEYGKQQQLRNEIICSEENVDDMMDTDDLYGVCQDESNDANNLNASNTNSSPSKPILKTVPKQDPPLSTSKRVRFSLEGKENNQQQSEDSQDDFTSIVNNTASAVTTSGTAADQPTTPVTRQTESIVKQKIVLPMNLGPIQSRKDHVKIVSEVLKKYPNLAKLENIKLRVVSKNPAAVPLTVQQAVEGDAGGGNKVKTEKRSKLKSASSTISYIFLTNKRSGELLPVQVESNEKDKLFDVENKMGPWFCHVCNEANPIEFESYYTYRRHLVEVHELKIDARICEYCGLRNSKRNHLLYHLYTKHGIDPPAHVSFPKCSECDYIALSDALLVKHKSTHDPKGLTCYTCNLVFKSFTSMQMHLQSSWHKSKMKEISVVVLSDYPCPFCESRFENGAQLKEHIETTYHPQGKQIYRCPYCEALFGDGAQLGKHIKFLHWTKNSNVSIQSSKQTKSKPQSGQQLQFSEDTESSGDVEETDKQTSSELESLNNVASGIATSLGLEENEQTVVFYEQRTESQDIGREATVIAGDECKEYIVTTEAVDVDGKTSQIETDDMEVVTIENEDSDSRGSNPEEINRITCSDHDYSEPFGENQIRQIIPVHSVTGRIPENATVIQQLIPEQRLVFSDQGNVVFQSPCVSIPQRVLVTSSKMVLPVAQGEQNLILSRVMPQTPILISGPIIQETGGIIADESEGTIVFANAEPVDQLEYSLQNPDEGKEEVERGQERDQGQEEVEEEGEDLKNDGGQEGGDEKESAMGKNAEGVEEKSEQGSEQVEGPGTGENATEETGEGSAESAVAVAQTRAETAKIVDDWDEANESEQNVESRSDGPSRPDFF